MLFRPEDVERALAVDDGGRLDAMPAHPAAGSAQYLVGRRGADLASLLPALPLNASADLITDGHWSLHEFIAYLLRLTGPSEVWITTWGISTEPLQSVLDMVRAGIITRLHLILHHRVVQQAPQAYQVLQAMSGDVRIAIRLVKIHAKLVVVENDAFKLRVATSANLTNNPRIEHYNISTHLEHVLGTRETLSLVEAGGKPFAAHG